MTIVERTRTRQSREIHVAGTRPAAQEEGPVPASRRQPPAAHVSVRGRAVEMIGLPPRVALSCAEESEP